MVKSFSLMALIWQLLKIRIAKSKSDVEDSDQRERDKDSLAGATGPSQILSLEPCSPGAFIYYCW